ncbi:MAG: hypothetical protein JW821_01760 [Deltaproteobacteria bacterium]|nr:hypothetical protein [Deltaproteobacteria bacterium]
MKWDLFSPGAKPKRSKIREDIENHIRAIERFAPREHAKERAARYYHYQILEEYLHPLSDLLAFLSQNRPEVGKYSPFFYELFRRLKGFYDPKGRLDAEEAIRDGNFIRKFSDVLVFFYGMARPSANEVKRSLRGLEGSDT